MTSSLKIICHLFCVDNETFDVQTKTLKSLDQLISCSHADIGVFLSGWIPSDQLWKCLNVYVRKQCPNIYDRLKIFDRLSRNYGRSFTINRVKDFLPKRYNYVLYLDSDCFFHPATKLDMLVEEYKQLQLSKIKTGVIIPSQIPLSSHPFIESKSADSQQHNNVSLLFANRMIEFKNNKISIYEHMNKFKTVSDSSDILFFFDKSLQEKKEWVQYFHSMNGKCFFCSNTILVKNPFVSDGPLGTSDIQFLKHLEEQGYVHFVSSVFSIVNFHIYETEKYKAFQNWKMRTKKMSTGSILDLEMFQYLVNRSERYWGFSFKDHHIPYSQQKM